jgi:hypothetical protein
VSQKDRSRPYHSLATRLQFSVAAPKSGLLRPWIEDQRR